MTHAPETEADLAQLIRGLPGPVAVRGGSTRAGPADGPAIRTAGLSGVVLYEPAALTLVVRAGTPLSVVEAVLAAEGQRLPFEPGDWRAAMGTEGTSTIGGVAAENASGPRRVQAGACRDSLIGVRFVDGRGEVVSNGGRVMKNVTGYDLVKLMAGSRGRLGVLTELSFKVQPIAPSQATIRVDVPVGAAPAVLAAGLGSPFDVTGAAWVAGQGALVRVEGLAGSVGYRAGQLRDRLSAFGEARVEEDGAIWAAVRDVAPLAGLPGDLWRFHLRPSQAGAVAARLGGAVMLDWGGGGLWARVPRGVDARAIAAPFDGHARRMTGTGLAPAGQPEPEAVARITDGLRAAFDPRGIFAGDADADVLYP